jgi:hypothetical protein
MAVNYITSKLKKDKFRPLLDDIEKYAGMRARSENSLVGGCVFFTHACITHKTNDGRTMFEIIGEMFGKPKHEMVLMFLNTFYEFMRSSSMAEYKKSHRKAMNNHNKN